MVAGWWAARCPSSHVVLASRSGRAALRGTAALQLRALCSEGAGITVASCDVSAATEVALLGDAVRQCCPAPMMVRQ